MRIVKIPPPPPERAPSAPPIAVAASPLIGLAHLASRSRAALFAAGLPLVAAAALLAGGAASTLAVEALLVLCTAGFGAIAFFALRRERAAVAESAALRRRWETFARHASDWYWETDAGRRITHVSPNAETAFGAATRSLIGRSIEDLVDPAMRESAAWRQQAADIAARRPFRDIAYRFGCANGQLRHFLASGDPRFAADGSFVGYCGTGRDVTALRRAESSLADAIEAMPGGFMLWDPDDRLVVHNSALGRVDPLALEVAQRGLSFAAFMHARVARGGIPDAAGREDAFVRERIAWHEGTAPEPCIVELAGDRWLQLVRSRTRDGFVVEIISDVTELKRREAGHARAEARLVDAIEALRDGFTLWDADDRLVLWNTAAQRNDTENYGPLHCGMRYADMMRERIRAGRILDANGREEQYLAERIAARRAAAPAPVLQRRSGGQWVRLAFHRTREGGLVTIRSDVTELKQREAQLKRAESRLVDAIEALGDGFILWDADDRMVVANSAVARVDPGATEILVPGMSFEDFLRERVGRGMIPEAAGREETLVHERLAWHRAATGEPLIQQLADGRWLRVTQHRTCDGGIVSIRSDITPAKEHEAALKRAESRLTDAIEALSDGFALWDADNRLVLWNSAVERGEQGSPVRLRRGARYEDLMRERIAAGWIVDAIGREEAYLSARLARRAAGVSEPLLQQLASGRWVRVSEHHTRDGSTVVVRTDVTELKERELDLIRARDEAEAANRAKSQFLATMSHELRTPLNAIIGFSDMLRNEVLGPLGSPRYAGYAADINASGQHLLALITDILDMSRIEAGRFELELEPIALAPLLEESLRMVRGRAEEQGIRLGVSVAPGLATLAADRRALKQILLNLLSNAIKFTRDGSVAVEAGPADDGGVMIAVIDSGAGIDPERLERIFEPFQRIDAKVARVSQGAGLGLSICKRLADLQGMTLAVASTLGVGTTVTLTVPRAARLAPVGP
jgi:PAS domain S-box-containing protein